MTKPPLDLKARAHQVMLDAGFRPDFSVDILNEAKNASASASKAAPEIKDLRNTLWSSIDNDSSRDLDQVEFVEKLADGSYRLLVGIADVDSFVPAHSLIDQHAASETTSVYPGVTVFPMLPDELSTDRTSLVNQQDRLSMVIETKILDSGEVTTHSIYRALLRNHAKLAYNATGTWLEGTAPIPPAVAPVPGMEAQLRLEYELSLKLRAYRKAQGSLSFQSIEATPVIENGDVKDLKVNRENAANNIIESFMVAANSAMAQQLKEKHALSIRRVVRVPKHWDRIQGIAAKYGVKLPSQPDPIALSNFLDQRRAADPEHFPDLSLSVVKMMGAGEYIVEHPGDEHIGHFGLGISDYTHSTAPNRRYSDLITQRLIKATIDDAPSPYSEKELAEIAARCTEREDAARKVERTMRDIMAAAMMNSHLGEVFDALVTGVLPRGTYVRLLKVPAQGMVVRRAQGLKVGDKIRVRVIHVDPARGYIDFEGY